MIADDITQVERYISELESQRIDLTKNYKDDWLPIGFALAELGEVGRIFFHRVSQFNPGYDPKECDEKFSNCLTSRDGRVNLGTFFQKCQDAGIRPAHTHNGKNYNGSGHRTNSNGSAKQKGKAPEEEKWCFNVNEVLNAPDQEVLWSFITKGVNNAIVASSEAGKSTLLLNLAVNIGLENEYFLGWPLNTPKGRTIYIATEDGISQLKNKLKSLAKDVYPIPEDSILFIFEGTNLAERLNEVLSQHPADLVIIDTWGDLVGGKYDAEFTRKTMSEIKQVCIQHDSTPLYVHHTNKASENIPEKASIKGAGDFEQACRVVMMLSIFREARWLCCVKGNPFPDDYKSTCYELGFNYETQTVFSTGREESRQDIIKALRSESIGRPGTDIDFTEILDQPLNNTFLVKKIMDVFGIARSTAQSKISKAVKDRIIEKDQYGLYSAK